MVDSALCMYKISNVEKAMKGLFKNNQEKEPKKPFNSCEDYKNLKNLEIDSYYKEITKSQKFQMEQSLNERALFALNNVKFTSIAVDSRTTFKQEHILFIGLSDGRILKVNGASLSKPVILGEYEIFEANEPINNLIISQNQIIAISNKQIKSIEIDSFCSSFTNCVKCIQIKDPYCSWSISQSKCLFSSAPQTQDFKCPLLQSNNNNQSILLNIIQSKSQNQKSKENNGITFLFFLFLFLILISSFLSVSLTCLYFKKFFIIQTKNTKKTLFLNILNTKLQSKKNLTTKTPQKLMNCYETKPVTVLCTTRPNSSSLTTNSIESNSNSPNNLLSKYSTINDTLSSSDDCFETVEVYKLREENAHENVTKNLLTK